MFNREDYQNIHDLFNDKISACKMYSLDHLKDISYKESIEGHIKYLEHLKHKVCSMIIDEVVKYEISEPENLVKGPSEEN